MIWIERKEEICISRKLECKQFLEATPVRESLSFTQPVWRGSFAQCPRDLVGVSPDTPAIQKKKAFLFHTSPDFHSRNVPLITKP